MRKVIFKAFIPAVMEGGSKVEGTGCFQSDYSTDGLFHEWGTDIEELNNGIGSYTVAIVELADGTVVQVFPQNIKFISGILKG